MEEMPILGLKDWKNTDVFMICYDRTNPEKSTKEALRYLKLAQGLCGTENFRAVLVGIKEPSEEQKVFEELIEKGKVKKKENYIAPFELDHWVRVGTWQYGLKNAFDVAIRLGMKGAPGNEKNGKKCEIM
jgi:hypothetical protein